MLFVCFFAVNLLVDFLGFSSHPASNTPTPYFMHIFEDSSSGGQGVVKNYWAEFLFFLLVFWGQIAIFRLRKLIFKSNQRKNG